MVNKIISLKSMIETSPHLKGIFFRYIESAMYDQGLAEEMFNHIYLDKEEVKTLVQIDQIQWKDFLIDRP